MVIKLLLVLMNRFWIRVVPIICSHKEWFFKFEEVEGGVVYMGNGDVNYISGIGSTRSRNHDGSIRVLTNVRCVQKLKNNLTSLA